MSPAMVDRLFWRAGFGPTAGGPRHLDRQARQRRGRLAAVGRRPASAGRPGTRDGKALDPTGDDTDLVLSWVDRMVRSTNPFVERMGFFWHRHFANSRQSVSPPQLLLRQNDLFRRYADFAANPNASFRDLAYEITVDPSMLRYLTGEYNVKGAPNENYAREFMELFGLGVLDAAGKHDLQRERRHADGEGVLGLADRRLEPGRGEELLHAGPLVQRPEDRLRQVRQLQAERGRRPGARAPRAPAPTSSRSCGTSSSPRRRTPRRCRRSSRPTPAAGCKLKPLLEQILGDKALFASLGEPTMVKPPVVYVVATLRTLGVAISDSAAADHLDAMGQVPYFPPTVAGWEGGLSWLNTNTALARFSFAGEALQSVKIDDVPNETASAAYDRAYQAVGQPWLAPGTQTAIRDYASRAGSSNQKLRKERQLMLRALMLAGPDGQVM